MAKTRKITVQVPELLLAKAQLATGAGITETVRTGLRLLVASHAYNSSVNFEASFVSRERMLSLKTIGDCACSTSQVN